jgi:hypothetical protein
MVFVARIVNCFRPTKDVAIKERLSNEESDEEKERIRILMEQLFESNYSLRQKSFASDCSVRSALSQIEGHATWAFDPLTIHVTPARFADIFIHALDDIINALGLNRANVESFALEVAQLYHDSANPYHNILHAVHVFHSMHLFLQIHECAKIKKYIVFAAYIAAFCHDIDHCGLTNRFLVATQHIKAVKYIGVAPQEMHHAATTLNLIDKTNLLAKSSVTNMTVFKEIIVKLILATNITDHKTVLDEFDETNPIKCIKLLLKCADLGHVFAPLESHIKWVDMLQSEFFIQGDKEKLNRLPVTTMFDRNTRIKMHQTQPNFFRIIALPMFDLLFKVFPSTVEHIKPQLEQNYSHWCLS